MTLTKPAPAGVSDAQAEALFKEARQRRRRRWALGVTVIVVASLVFGVLLLTRSAAPRSKTPTPASAPRLPAADGAHRVPGVYVAGDGRGGVGVYSTATGSLIRTLSAQSPGGPDGQVVLSADRQSVFFAQPSGTCGGDILRVPISGAGAPTTVISVPGTLAASPSPSPTSNELAWVGVACDPKGAAGSSSLYLTDLNSGSTSELGAINAQNSDDEIAWSADGSRLAVENAGAVTTFVRRVESFTKSVSLRGSNSCRLSSPGFLARRHVVAVINSCYGVAANHADRIVAFDASTGKRVGALATAPAGARFQGLSIDTSGRYVLVGIVRSDPAGAELARIAGARLVTVSRNSVTDSRVVATSQGMRVSPPIRLTGRAGG